MVVLCQMPELGLNCFGCCGNNYSNKRKLMRDIHKNNIEFDNKKSLSRFMERKKELRSSGICANLILKDGRFFCPGHLELHGGRDYRNLDPNCEKEFVCKTYGLFQQWDNEKQQKFLEFLKEKINNGMDSYTYSIRMDNNSLLKEFEGKIRNK